MLVCVLGACGRFGFTDPPPDGTSSRDASDATADGDVALDEVLVTVYRGDPAEHVQEDVWVVVVQSDNSTAVYTTDANGQVHAPAQGNVSIHVADFVVPYWELTTWEDVSPGMSIQVGHQPLTFSTRATITTAPYAGATSYSFYSEIACGVGGLGSRTMTVPVPYGACKGGTRAYLMMASDGTNVIAAQLAPSVDEGASVTLPDAWQVPQSATLRVDAMPAGFSILDSNQRLLHAAGSSHVQIDTTQSAVGNVVNATVYPVSIDAARVLITDPTTLIDMVRPVVMEGSLAVMPASLMPRTFATATRTADGATWTLAQPGTPTFMRAYHADMLANGEQTASSYFLAGDRTSFTRFQWPAPLERLNDIATAFGTTLYIYDVAGETYATMLPTVARRFGAFTGTGQTVGYAISSRPAQ